MPELSEIKEEQAPSQELAGESPAAEALVVESVESPAAKSVESPASEPPAAPKTKLPRRGWRRVLLWIVVLVVVPAIVVLFALYGRRFYILISILLVALAMVPFFVQFERRRPQARELVTIAVMVAIAVASRALFAFLPSFKPMAAIIMVTGIALGPSTGFLAGALSALVSNFIFGQGPWTPWQMLAFGLCGFVFGLLADAGLVKRAAWTVRDRLAVSLGGAVFIVLIAGPVLDTSSLLWMVSDITPESALAIYLAGLPLNAVHAAATFVTLFIVGNPMLDKLQRLKTKYGMMN